MSKYENQDPNREPDELRYGDSYWFDRDGKLHRDGDLPATVCTDGLKVYRKHGLLHRGGGKPAVIRPDGAVEYWVDGVRMDKQVDAPEDTLQVTPQDADMVNHPPHYQGDGIECIDAIRAALGKEGFIAYCRGNALKYIWREKVDSVEDRKKAIWYLNKANEVK